MLKIPGDEIGVKQEFSTLGGDSILAIPVVSKLKTDGYRITIADVAAARTIATLAARIARTGGDVAALAEAHETTDTLFDLTPMQQFYANFTLGLQQALWRRVGERCAG